MTGLRILGLVIPEQAEDENEEDRNIGKVMQGHHQIECAYAVYLFNG